MRGGCASGGRLVALRGAAPPGGGSDRCPSMRSTSSRMTVRICAVARSSTARPLWRVCYATLSRASCSTNMSPGMVPRCSRMLAGPAQKASSQEETTAPTDPVRVRCGSRSAIPPALLCSGSAARIRIGDGGPTLPSKRLLAATAPVASIGRLTRRPWRW